MGLDTLGRWPPLFPFRVDHLSKGRQNNFDRITCPGRVFISLNYCTDPQFKGNKKTFKKSNAFNTVRLPSEKGVHTNRKEFTPKGSKFFLLRVNTFLQGNW